MNTTHKVTFKPALLRFFILTLFFIGILAQAPMSGVHARAGETLSLTKTIDGGITNANVGDIVFYRIHFACSSLTTDCGQLRITDTLPAHPVNGDPVFEYVPSQSYVSGAGIYSMSEAGGVVTITSPNFQDGSQADAVIALRIRYDVRPLTTTVTNTASGQIWPADATGWSTPVTDSAPPLTINLVTADWTLTKTRISPGPLVEPTVDTDVVYRVNFCPTTTSGNVEITNVTITDTLPLNSTFVSATGVYTYTAQVGATPGTVEWDIAGPITPPNCVERYVTIQYTDTNFNIGDPVSNSVSATADYEESDEDICPDCIGENDDDPDTIADIAEVPRYSKRDDGDPVGITGTARFILSLDTILTNWPTQDLVLIDSLPEELKVISITSGAWSGGVQALISYSTDNGGSWTPLGTATGTNVIYNGLPNNITDVRWVFSYDPDGFAPFNYSAAGLPYNWAFGTSPEIRVTPRPANDPVGMNPASAGNTYRNCLSILRTDSDGNTVDTGPCGAHEDILVEGNYVSLRTAKAETPGIAYDPENNPLINPFTADSSIMANDTLHYVITVEVTERSSAPLVNPTIRDIMPPQLIFVRNGTAQLDGMDLPQQPTFTQNGQTLTWEWNNPSPALNIPPNSPPALGSRYLTVDFYARIPPGTPDATYTNDLYVVTDSLSARCEIGTQVNDATDDTDGNGLPDNADGDSVNPDIACVTDDDFRVERAAALRGEKWIRSVDAENSVVVRFNTFMPPAGTPADPACPDGGTAGLTGSANPFTRYPCVSQAFPEGALANGQHVPPPTSTTLDDFEYNLRIFNEGNVPMLEYVLYDILPYYGDTGSGGALANTARDSDFQPALRGPITFIQGRGLDALNNPVALAAADFIIEYNATTNPCRPEVFDRPVGALVPSGCNNTWTNDWATARSYRIRLNNDATALTPNIAAGVAAGTELRFGVPMYIPADVAPLNDFTDADPQTREIAWNSFSHVGSYDRDPAPGITEEDLLASEPRKVGITIPERFSIGNRVWRDSDNSGDINPPDDTDPGIAGVTVNLYTDNDSNGLPDDRDGSGTFDSTLDRLAFTVTDNDTADPLNLDRGYYLFSNLPAGRYIVGIPASNFGAGQPLRNLRSSTGTPSVATYTNPPETNPDQEDHGRAQAPCIPLANLNAMAEQAVDMLHRAVGAFVAADAETARRIPAEDDQVDELYNQVYRDLVAVMIGDPSTVDRANHLLWVAHNLERVADRVSNICERTVYIATGQLLELDVSPKEKQLNS